MSALCDSAQRDRSLSTSMLPMPPRHAKGSLAMTAIITFITFIVFACGLGAMGRLAFETPDIRDREE